MNDSQIDFLLARLSGGLTIATLFRQQVAFSRDKTAVQDKARALTYAQLDERTDRLANALARRGIGAGDRVGVLSENSIEYVELEIAVAKLGAILACQNWRQADDELRHCLRLVAPKIVFVSPRFIDALARIDHGASTIVVGEEYERTLAAADARSLPDIASPENGLIILYTSGTTGMPKGALISQRAMIARNMIARIDLGLSAGCSFVAWAPMFHMVSTDNVYGTLMNGGNVIVMDGLDVGELVDWTQREQIGHLTLMPGMIDRVIDEMKGMNAKPKPMVSIGCMADLRAAPPDRGNHHAAQCAVPQFIRFDRDGQPAGEQGRDPHRRFRRKPVEIAEFVLPDPARRRGRLRRHGRRAGRARLPWTNPVFGILARAGG
jgi:fatty-acyl-CoA synthase